MNEFDVSSLRIPEPLRGSDPGSFAERTVRVRMPEIARRVLAENEFPAEIAACMQALIDEMPSGKIRPIQDPGAPDLADWESFAIPYIDQTWLEIPWFFAEHYFYRRILEATGYFQTGNWQERDPYAHQKLSGLRYSQDLIQALAENLNHSLEVGWQIESFVRLVNADLWGNQADLSLWPASKSRQPSHAAAEQRQHLLVDDAILVAGYVEKLRQAPAQVQILVDNAGFELVADLCLVDYLLSTTDAFQVTLQLKAQPTFVSDALPRDVIDTVNFLGEDDQHSVREFASRVEVHLSNERLLLKQDTFWTSPLESWKMPSELRKGLGQAALAISKGDAHYRRWLGDRHWLFDTPLDQILCYFPAPLLILRASKSEVMAGLRPGQAEKLYETDPEWLYNGRWGLIQLWQPTSG